jgi:transposase
MHRLGFEYKRPKSLPAQADEAKQAAFIEDYDKLLRGLADDEAVYFVDAAHPEYQGRQRINLHGALNLENFHCPLVQAERINAASTIALFEKLEASNPGKRWIYAIADNARYHHARLVRQWLERPGCRIKLIFQPAYAPHLNAIERLWGVLHREVTHNSFYATFAQFTEAIDDFFARSLPRQWKIWRDTITDNFRIISHREFRVLG